MGIPPGVPVKAAKSIGPCPSYCRADCPSTQRPAHPPGACPGSDSNEVAGIRLPPIAVPLGTYTGWNVYRAHTCELCDRDGSLIPFARTRSERETASDPRAFLEERYGTRDAYVARVEAAASALVADYLL